MNHPHKIAQAIDLFDNIAFQNSNIRRFRIHTDIIIRNQQYNKIMFTLGRAQLMRQRRRVQHLSSIRAASNLLLLILMMTVIHIQVVISYAIVAHPPLSLPNVNIAITSTTAQSKRVRYNLGIRSSSEIETTDEVIKTTHYWVEHESVNEYPSPMKQVQQRCDVTSSSVQQTVTNDNGGTKKKQHPPLIPNRLTDDDILKIVSDYQSEDQASSVSKSDRYVVKAIAHPTMRSGHDFDINTAWIELLIHEQQMKLSTNLNFNAIVVVPS